MRAPSKTVDRARRLRRTLTLPEAILWRALRRRTLAGLRFRCQHPVGPYVLDFYCPEARLALEVDGAAHDHPLRAAQDEQRTAWLAEQGIRVLRLPARDVLRGDDAEHVLPTIAAACGARRRMRRAPATVRRAPGSSSAMQGRCQPRHATGDPPLRSGGGGSREAADGGGYPLRSTSAPSTGLRPVPLPRDAGRNPWQPRARLRRRDPPLRSGGGGSRPAADGGGYPLRSTSAPATGLRPVPLPRDAGEDPG